VKVVQYPEMGWLGRHFLCPACGVLVEFEIEDLKGVGHFKPRLIEGHWSAIVQCPVDGKVQTFREVRNAGE